MKGSLAFWAVVILLPVLHFLLHVGLGLGGEAPDLLTVALLVAARQVRPGVAAGLGFGFGIAEDALSLLSFGANATALTVVGFLGARSRDLFMAESLAFVVAYLAVGVWLKEAIHWAIVGGRIWAEAPAALLVQAPIAALYAAAVGTVILRFMGAWEGDIRR